METEIGVVAEVAPVKDPVLMQNDNCNQSRTVDLLTGTQNIYRLYLGRPDSVR